MSYNGHKNWNHWNVSLWIANDEGLYSLAKSCLRHGRTRGRAAELLLAELRELGCDHTPDGAPYTRTSIRAALAGL